MATNLLDNKRYDVLEVLGMRMDALTDRQRQRQVAGHAAGTLETSVL